MMHLARPHHALFILFDPFTLAMLLFREVNEDALEVTLSAAVTCTILAAAGPQRSRVLATLYKVCFDVVNEVPMRSIHMLLFYPNENQPVISFTCLIHCTFIYWVYT